MFCCFDQKGFIVIFDAELSCKSLAYEAPAAAKLSTYRYSIFSVYVHQVGVVSRRVAGIEQQKYKKNMTESLQNKKN